MSIVRVGLAETKNFSEGYDLIFGKKKDQEQQKTEQTSENKPAESAEEQKK